MIVKTTIQTKLKEQRSCNKSSLANLDFPPSAPTYLPTVYLLYVLCNNAVCTFITYYENKLYNGIDSVTGDNLFAFSIRKNLTSK